MSFRYKRGKYCLYQYKQFYIVVFEWADGECLFDHWNFEKYKKDNAIKSPKERFKDLPASKKIIVADVLFSFLDNVNKKGYVAVDFYDGSIRYDFTTGQITICDIDLYRKAPVKTFGEFYSDWKKAIYL